MEENQIKRKKMRVKHNSEVGRRKAGENEERWVVLAMPAQQLR